MGKRRWTNDTRIVKPILEANGYFALNNGHNCNGSHTKFVNANGEVISVPKSIMLQRDRSILKFTEKTIAKAHSMKFYSHLI